MRFKEFCVLLFALVFTFCQSINYRLPTDSVPHHYKMKLIPHILSENYTFDGESKIYLKVLKPTKNLTLNALNLNIHHEITNLMREDRDFLPNQQIIDEEKEFLILTFHEELTPGNYILHLKYSGELNKFPTGFFRDYYLNDHKEKV